MSVDTLNVLAGEATLYAALWGLTTPGAPEPAPSDPAPRTDACTVTSGSATVADTHCLSTDAGAPVTGTGIPAGTYVGTVTPATSFTLVNALNQPVDATANGTSVVITTGVSYGQAWGGNWTAVGATESGVNVAVDTKTVDGVIEEQTTPVYVAIDTQDIQVVATLAEDTLNNLMLAAGTGSIATQAATSSLIGKSTFNLGTALTPYSVGFEGLNPAGFYRRGYFPKMVSGNAKVSVDYRRAKTMRLYACTFRLLCPVGLAGWWDMTAEPT